MSSERVVLYGGPFSGQSVSLSRTPERIEILGRLYERINDPDTGEGLGAYVLTEAKDKNDKRR